MALAARAAGIGLRAPHYRELAERRPALGFLEAHAENFFGDGGEPLAWLERFRADYELTLHGVGLSLGSVDVLDEEHLRRLAALVDRFQPALVSEHLSWSSVGGRHANELLPLPHTAEAVRHLVARITAVQERLRRPLLVENIAAYVRFPESALAEAEFLCEVARRSGCLILLDVNNVWVNAAHHGFDPAAYIEAIDPRHVAEFHLAGFEATPRGPVDTHGARVSEEVWSLYARALARIGPRPALIEWDIDIPPLDVLLGEAARANQLAARSREMAEATP